MKGTLRVDLAAPSQLLGDLLQFDVRDAHMRRVAIIDRHRSLELEPGQYLVSAVLEDGRTHEAIVQIEPGREHRARFAANPIAGRPAPAETGALAFPRIRGPGELAWGASEQLDLLRRLDASRNESAPGPLEPWVPETYGNAPLVNPRPLVEVSASPGVRLTSVTALRWQVDVEGPGAHWARFAVADQAWKVSLPTASGDARASVEVELREHQGDGQRIEWRPRACIAPWRVVASSIEQMLGEHEVEQALAVADQAAQLLLEKYRDPVGAILGALMLQRSRQLPQFRGWLTHLAEAFPWWPDAAILLALLDGSSPERSARDAALERLLAASEMRPCFTESYALLLDGLRRWRDEGNEQGREEALSKLVLRHGTVDWSALTFTHSD